MAEECSRRRLAAIIGCRHGRLQPHPGRGTGTLSALRKLSAHLIDPPLPNNLARRQI